MLNELGVGGENVIMYGEVSPDAKATLYRHCDLFCIAASRCEYFISVAHAMMFGIPVLALNNEAIADLAGTSCVIADDSEAYAEALQALSCDVETLDRLAASSRARYEAELANSRVKEAFAEALDNAIGASRENVKPDRLVIDSDWYGIPNANRIIASALKTLPEIASNAFDGNDRRIDFIDWVLREGWKGSDELAGLLTSPEFAKYVEQLELSAGGSQLTPMMRLVWKFHRYANARFSLRSAGVGR